MNAWILSCHYCHLKRVVYERPFNGHRCSCGEYAYTWAEGDTETTNLNSSFKEWVEEFSDPQKVLEYQENATLMEKIGNFLEAKNDKS